MLKIINARHSYPEAKGFYMQRPHGHGTDYIFLFFHTSVEITLNGEAFKTAPGAMIIFDKTTPQFFKAHEDMIHDWIHIDGNLPEIMRQCELLFNRVYYPSTPEFITQTIRTIESEFQASKRYSTEMCDILLRSLLYRISRSLLDGEREIDETNDTIRRMRDFRTRMFSSLERPWSVADMASEVAISESRFFALYREIFGTSPTKDLITARIERAKFHLSTGKYSVSEVASFVGYNNVFHFIRQYKLLMGETPGKIIENIKKGK